MNTILVTGSVRQLANKQIMYDLYIWGSKEGEQIQVVTMREIYTQHGYNDMWLQVKPIVAHYFDEPKFQDGAYTQFLDHLISK